MDILEQLDAEEEAGPGEYERDPGDRVRYILDGEDGVHAAPDASLVEKGTAEDAGIAVEDTAVQERSGTALPLFHRSDPDTYRAAEEVVSAVDGPYLAHATSLRDIELASVLYTMNPDVDEDLLEQYTFETLVAYERARDELPALRAELEEIEGRREERHEGYTGAVRRAVDRTGLTGYDEEIRELEETIETYTSFVERVEGGMDD